MLNFQKEWTPDELHLRDLYQFELKSEVNFNKELPERSFTQEFYLFVPQALQIDKKNYSKEEFYRDHTHFTRLKTPEFTLEQLSNTTNPTTPFYKILNERKTEHNLKLFGNCFRSALRQKCIQIVHDYATLDTSVLEQQVTSLTQTLSHIKNTFRHLTIHPLLHETYTYLDEFLSVTTDYYLTALFSDLHHLEKVSPQSKKALTNILKKEKEYRNKNFQEPFTITNEEENTREDILYRRKLLNKFLIDCLLLKTDRIEPVNKLKTLTASIAAGLAMLIQVLLLINLVNSQLLYNSISFILATVLIYILKDRTKDLIKNLFIKKGRKYFPDFNTKIFFSDKKSTLGTLKETFTIFPTTKLPNEIKTIRNKEFHTYLELFRRPENVIYYTSDLRLNKKITSEQLTTLFRFDISRFLSKAGNPYHTYHDFDVNKEIINQKMVPKIYHLNLIIKESHPNSEVVYRKYRVIINKLGIKRIEKISTLPSPHRSLTTPKTPLTIHPSTKITK